MEEKHYLAYTAEEIDRRLGKVDDIPTKTSQLENDSKFITADDLPSVELPENIATLDDVAKKQDKLISGENIKTINGQSVLGKGNIIIEGGNGNVDLSGYVTKLDADKAYQPKGDYALNTNIPTKVSQLTNDSEFVNKEELATKQDTLTPGQGISIDNNVVSCTLDTKLYKIVTELPAVGEEHKIYLIESSVQGEQNIYTEYGYINGAWEELGQYRAKIDLEPYALKTEIPTKTSELVNDSNFATKADIPPVETYVLNFTIQDGIDTGAYDATEYAKLRAAIEAGKLIIIGGAVTRVTADSQAMAADYVVIRYGTPRIGDDNNTVTWSVYELKFSATTYESKAIHKVIK